MANKSITDATKFRWSQPKGATGRRLLLRRVALFTGLVTAVLLLVVGFWIHRSTEAALRDKLHVSLETILATDVAALEFWMPESIEESVEAVMRSLPPRHSKEPAIYSQVTFPNSGKYAWD